MQTMVPSYQIVNKVTVYWSCPCVEILDIERNWEKKCLIKKKMGKFNTWCREKWGNKLLIEKLGNEILYIERNGEMKYFIYR